MSTVESQDHSTVPPTLDGRKTRPADITNIVLQLQNDFGLLRYLLFSSIGTIPTSDSSVKNSAISPPINPNPTSTALPSPCADEPSIRRSIPESAMGPPREKPNNFANADFQSSPYTLEAPLTTMQNLTS